METNVVKERLAFVHDLESGHWSMTELCERYGVTPPDGLQAGSRAITPAAARGWTTAAGRRTAARIARATRSKRFALGWGPDLRPPLRHRLDP